MGYVLIAGVVGMWLGFALGVLAMGLLAASHPDERLASWPEAREPASVRVGTSRSRSIVG